MTSATQYYVYTITNLTSKQQYVGFTKNPKSRWSEHCKPGFAGRPITDVILSEGKENFEFKVVGTFGDEESARKAETMLIYCLKTTFPNGYNRNVKGYSGPRWTPESRAELGETLRKMNQAKKNAKI
jgi:group I intron endonuclease